MAVTYRLIVVVILLSGHFSVAGAEPMPPMEDLELTLKIGDAQAKIEQGSRFYEEAKKLCREAEDFLAKYDREPSQNASVLHCFADVEVGGKHIKEACGLYARALRDYKTALPAQTNPISRLLVTEQIQKISAAYPKLGCNTGRYVVPTNWREIAEQKRKLSETCAGKDNVSPDAQITACNAVMPIRVRDTVSLLNCLSLSGLK